MKRGASGDDGNPVTAPERESAVVRLAGDSGDGIQLVGAQLTRTAALGGNAVWTPPEFPAEIRAPAGSLAGVSGFQVQFGDDVHTPGDRVDVLVAMNPAALKTHLKDLDSEGVLIVNRDAFAAAELAKAGYAADPLRRRFAARPPAARRADHRAQPRGRRRPPAAARRRC